MDKIDKILLQQIADLHKIPSGAFNIRKNGQVLSRNSTKEIEIIPKKDGSGIDIIVAPNTKNKSVHIPVIVTVGNFSDTVCNDFYIGENCDVTIIAGCGIDNPTCNSSQHSGIHSFYLKPNSHVRYVEKHYGQGEGKKILNPVTNLFLDENSFMEMETLQIEGVDSSIRNTNAKLKQNAKLIVKENLLTAKDQKVKTNFKITLAGKNSSADIVSHSVAKDSSSQKFVSNMIGRAECFGHVECDGILLDDAKIISVPKISALSKDSSLVHEAAIGKIAGDELIKLMTLGLSEEDAEKTIIEGFLMG